MARLRLHTTFCEHYRAMSEHATCEAGVPYEQFRGLTHDERPCFIRDGDPGRNAGKCDKFLAATPEQIAERKRLLAERFERVGKARAAIVAHLGGPWKKGTHGAGGVIDCPACGGKETLRFSRSGYNGHIHAGCTTADCVRWME
jgi:hypothetical protein